MTTHANPFELAIESRFGGIFINFILIPVLILAALLLPPIALLDRALSIGYESIGHDGGAIQDPDGTQLTFDSDDVDRSFKVKLIAIPRSQFLEGSAGVSLLAAAESIPPNLIMKSPYYRIQVKRTVPAGIQVKVPIPNEAEPYSTMDLYGWTGESWEWIPSQTIIEDDSIEASLDYVPESVVVMQTQPVNPNISADYTPDQPYPALLAASLVEVNPVGLFLDSDGQISGDIQLSPEIQSGNFIIIPTIRNWHTDGSIRSDLVDNMLIQTEARDRHVQALVEVVQSQDYPGIDLDYRGITPDLSSEFTTFLEQLRQALPENKQLSVRVELPQQLSADTWESGAYDWQAIGRVANVVKVPTSPDPRAYAPAGPMEAMLNWATGEINRYKIQLLLSTLSTKQADGLTQNVTYQQALEPMGATAVVGGENIVGPGQAVDFTLNGLQASTGIQFDDDSGSYWYAYLDENNVQHTIYLENAASIARKLQYVPQYHLRGVAVQNLLGEDSDGQIQAVLQKFASLVIPPVENNYSVVWQVQNEEGVLLLRKLSL